VWTVQASYIGNQKIRVKLIGTGDTFSPSSNTVIGIFSTGDLGGFTGFGVEALSTVPAQIYGSTAPGGSVPVMVVA
jgi:hypothetical protein